MLRLIVFFLGITLAARVSGFSEVAANAADLTTTLLFTCLAALCIVFILLMSGRTERKKETGKAFL